MTGISLLPCSPYDRGQMKRILDVERLRGPNEMVSRRVNSLYPPRYCPLSVIVSEVVNSSVRQSYFGDMECEFELMLPCVSECGYKVVGFPGLGT